jgi:hypothetical protein
MEVSWEDALLPQPEASEAEAPQELKEGDCTLKPTRETAIQLRC